MAQIGTFRKSHKRHFTKIKSQNPTYSLKSRLPVFTKNIKTYSSKADCGSQRHSRPSGIISALKRSIILAWGLKAHERAI